MSVTEDWIKRKCEIEDLTEIGEIRNFSILWNYFEAEKFNKNGSFSEIDNYLNKINEVDFNNEECRLIKSAFDYFRTRYNTVTNGYNEEINRLNFKKKELIKFRQAFNIDGTKIREMLLVLLMISFRYRNNLFHGEKDIDMLKDYNTPFKILNELIMVLNDKL